MKIPKYWARANQSVQDEEGNWLNLTTWRWSDVSTDEARQLAQARVQEIAAKVQRGETLNRYWYGDRPLREEAIQALSAGSKELGVITRNRYGALVLNAAQAMFIDIDFGEEGPVASLSAQLRKLSGRAAPPTQEQRVLASLQQWAAQNPGIGLRVYRTAGGVRGLITNQLFDPTQDQTQELLRELNCDPLYVKLCRDQQCFRARLSPKPWRCDIETPPSGYPWEDARAETNYRAWEEKYQRVASRYDVCRLLAQIGSPEVHPEIQPILTVHDQSSYSGRNLQLA